MLENLNNIGDEIYRSWTDEQRRHEIGNLVQGLKQGLPVPIFCQLATSIAGSPAQAREHLCALLTPKERKRLVKQYSAVHPEIRPLLETTLQ